MQRRPARLRGVRFTPRPELLEDRRLLTGLLRSHVHARASDPPGGEAAPEIRGGLPEVNGRNRVEAPSVASAWQAGAPIPLARTEVAAAVLAGEIIVVGGFLQDGSSTSRVDAYSVA